MKINFQSRLNMRKLDNLISRMKKAVNGTDDITQKYCIMLRNTMIEGIMTTPKTGRVYGNHISSSPGNYPANWTGELIAGISISPPSFGFRQVKIEVDYAAALEYGAKYGNRVLLPRPFVNPSIDKLKPDFEKDVKNLFFRSYI